MVMGSEGMTRVGVGEHKMSDAVFPSPDSWGWVEGRGDVNWTTRSRKEKEK